MMVAHCCFRDKISNLEYTAPIIVKNNVYIGVRSIIIPEVPDNSVVAGVPTQFIKSTNDYLERLKLKSLGLAHLKGKGKDDALKEYFRNKSKF